MRFKYNCDENTADPEPEVSHLQERTRFILPHLYHPHSVTTDANTGAETEDESADVKHPYVSHQRNDRSSDCGQHEDKSHNELTVEVFIQKTH